MHLRPHAFCLGAQPYLAGKLDHALPPAYYLPKAGMMREPCKVRGTRLSIV
jgi:hypothetical protein